MSRHNMIVADRPKAAGRVCPLSGGLFGALSGGQDLVAILADDLLQKFSVTLYSLRSSKSRHLNVTVTEHCRFDSLSDQRDSDRNRVGLVTGQCVMDVRRIQLVEQFEQWMTHLCRSVRGLAWARIPDRHSM